MWLLSLASVTGFPYAVAGSDGGSRESSEGKSFVIVVREMEPGEFEKVREIDVSETGDMVYSWRNGRLMEMPHEWQRRPWSEERCLAIAAGKEKIAGEGGTVLGAFDDERLVGEAVLVPHLTETMAQLESLHVSSDYRRQGVARQLVDEVIRRAKEAGAQTLYVSATPSRSAVGFYQSIGFTPTSEPHPGLLALEPEDIHMTMPL